jgi:hypothetical protein
VAISHGLCPIATSYDSRWTVPVALSLIHHANVDLDEYLPLLEANEYYAVERLNGHYYNSYPPGGPLLAAPIVATIEAAVKVTGPLLRRIPVRSPILYAFFAGDLVTSRSIVEMLSASIMVAATAAILFRVAALFLPLPWAGLVVATFSFGSSAWSTGSRALWQHTPSMLLLTITLWIAVQAIQRPERIQFAAIPLAISFSVRPTNAISAVVLTVYVFFYYRKFFLKWVLWAAPFALAFAAASLGISGHILPNYFQIAPADTGIGWTGAFAGLLFSPSRGWLVFTPWILFAVWGAILAVRTSWLRPLPACLGAIVVLHLVLLCNYSQLWWGGHSYGPRLFTDVMPFVSFFLIPLFREWHNRRPGVPILMFAVALALSVFVHSRGATSAAVWQWNVEPANVDFDHKRLWNWRDPQFLRGL